MNAYRLTRGVPQLLIAGANRYLVGEARAGRDVPSHRATLAVPTDMPATA